MWDDPRVPLQRHHFLHARRGLGHGELHRPWRAVFRRVAAIWALSTVIASTTHPMVSAGPITDQIGTAPRDEVILHAGSDTPISLSEPTRHMIITDDQVALDRVRTVLDLVGRPPRHVWRHGLLGVSVDIGPSTAAVIASIDGVTMVGTPSRVEVATTQDSPPWGLDRIDQASLPLDEQYVFDSDGSGVIVYVIDSGLRADHDDVTGRIPYGAYYDYAADRLIGPTDSGWNDCTGHGTHVASIAAGSVAGVAKGATIVPIKVLGSATNPCDSGGESDAVVAAIDWILATHPADTPGVAVMSFGVVPGQGDTDGIDPILDAAVATLVDAGITTAVAAGNIDSGSRVSDACLLSPARVPSVITVGASDSTDNIASFSAGGDCVDIIAPGVSIRAAGIGGPTDRTAVRTGTSMAAPHVAGVAARLLSDTADLTPEQVWATIADASVTGVLTTSSADQPDRLLHIGSDAVTVSVALAGVGSVSGLGSTPCTSMCSALVSRGSTITLTATGGEWSAFAGWSGACDTMTEASCTLTVAGPIMVTAEFTADDLVQVIPTRLLDTRSGIGGVDAVRVGRPDGTGPALEVTVAGRGGLPHDGVAAVAVNLTATDTVGEGFVSAYPCGADSPPNISQLNFTDRATVANSALLPVSEDGTVCLYVYGAAHLIVDVSGWLPERSGFHALEPQRIADTRGVIGAIGTTSAGPTTVRVSPTAAGIPTTGVSSVAINLTAVNAVAPPEGGYAVAYPCASVEDPQPGVSTLNFTGTMTVPNSVLVPTRGDDICVFVYGQANVLVDVVGWFGDDGDLVARSPQRIIDTRGGIGAPAAPVGAVDGSAAALVVDIAALAALPTAAHTAIVNVTAVNTVAVGAGFISVYPCTSATAPPPNVSTLNFTTGSIVANGALTGLANGQACVWVYGRTDVIIDVAGWFVN